MSARLKRFRELAVFAVVTAFVAAVVVAAVNADVRSTVRTETNDGGAWLVKQDSGVIGQVDRASMEVSGYVAGPQPNSDFDVDQTDSIVLMNDRGAGTVMLVDPSVYESLTPITAPKDLRAATVHDGAVLWTESPLKVWHLGRSELASVEDLTTVQPVVAPEKSTGVVAVTRNDSVLVVDRKGDALYRFSASPDAEPDRDLVSMPLNGRGEGVKAVSAIGDDAVVMDDRSIAIIPASASDGDDVQDATRQVIEFDTGTDGYVLAQPSDDGSPVIAVSPDGRVVSSSATPPHAGDDEVPVAWTAGELFTTTPDPMSPIVYAGCVFSLSRQPVMVKRWCDGKVDEESDLDGLDVEATSLRLKLVNGWVWINDLSTGDSAVLGPDGKIERLDDWGAAFGTEEKPNEPPEKNENNEDQPSDDEAIVERDDLPEIDEDEQNEPPIAKDDDARTRVDQPIVLPVLKNDTDPDGDVILVTDVTAARNAQVGVNADRTEIQVNPAAGYNGKVQFQYTISDGRENDDGSPAIDTATVTVDVIDDRNANEAPVTEVDKVEVTAGSSVTLNVLDNDNDPDGDALLLESITSEAGSLTSDPSGQVTFTAPNDNVTAELDIPYTARDTYGATSEGRMEVKLRIKGANNEPIAENDSRVTVVGRPITFNVLTNDSDPDNDPLSVSSTILETRNSTEFAIAETSISPDGEFFFTPSKPGEYVFVYRATDGTEEDKAIIRVDVSPEQDNRPPTAVRDDVTIARGSARTVYALENDTDPDGDVVAIESWTPTEGIEVEEARGVGFRIKVEPSAPDEIVFRYSISDGEADPVGGVVVIAATDAEVVDQAPVAKPDAIEVRPGQTGGVRVLLNDYDPEGGALAVVKANSARNAQVRIGPGGQEIFVTPDSKVVSGFSFGYDVIDDGGNRSSSFVNVRIVPDNQANRPPIARPDTARTRAGTPVNIHVADNDSDPDGDAVRVESIAAQPAFGQASLNSDGTISYRASPDAVGSDLFRYVLVDAKGKQAIGTVLVGVLPADGRNRPPTATDDSFSMLAGSDPLRLDLLRNDYDPNGDSLAITEVRGAVPHAALDPETGSVTFSPPDSVPGGTQKYTFRYTLSDGRGETDKATVSVEVSNATEPVAPIAVADLHGPVKTETPTEVDVLANDLDPDGSRADLTVTSNDPAVTVGDDGVLTIDVGTESAEYQYTVTDPDGLTSSTVVTVIAVPNRAPEPEEFTVTTDYGKSVVVDVDEHVVDPDGDALQYGCCDSVRHGRATIVRSSDDNLAVKFMPNQGFSGEAGFVYQVDDQNGHTVEGSAVVTVKPPANRPPVATDGTAEVEAGTNGLVSFTPFASDEDIASGDDLSFEMLDAGGAPARPNGANVRIDAPLDAGGSTYTLTFRVTDSFGESDEGKVVVTVTESKVPPPVANPDSAQTNQEQAVDVNVVANDTNTLGRGGLQVVSASVTSGSGIAEVTGNSTSVVFTPAQGFFGQATVQYTIQDARGTEAGQARGLVTINVLGKPSPPVVTSASADNATATITWSSPANNGAAITAYVVGSDQGHEQNVGLTNSFTFDGLQNGVPHRFQVKAINEAGESDWGPFSDPVTPDTEPGTPAAPIVQFADSALIVTWAEPANEGSAITGYDLEIGGAANSKISDLGTTSYTWDGLTNGSNYQFRVTAKNAAGPSAPSAWSASEHPLSEPGPPSQPVPVQGDSQINLSWSAGDTNGDPISRYEVMRVSSGEIRPATGTNFTWSPLPNGVEQQFRVRAFNRDPDPGLWSAASPPMKPCGVPDKISAVTAVRGDQQARVSWSAPNSQGCDITNYTVTASNGMSQSTQSTTIDFGPLTNGEPVSFRVYASNVRGDGAQSDPSNTVTPAGPPIGPNQTAAAPTGVGEITVTWDPANDNGAPLTDYQVIINSGSPVSAGAGDTSYVHSGLAPGSTYTYQVKACNDVGCGPLSGASTASTWTYPSAPAAPSLSDDGDRTLIANWSAPSSDGGTPVTSYNARINPGGITPTTATTASWPGLTYGQTYSVDVQACNAVGCGAWSAASSWTIHGAPAQVATPSVWVTNRNTLNASWNQPNMNGSALAHYNVERRANGSTASDQTTSRSISWPDRSYDTTYDVRVQACSTDRGCGPWSNWNSARTDSPPPPPQQVNLSRGGACSGASCPPPGSCSSTCYFYHIDATGFSPNTTYSYTCYNNGSSFGSGGSRTTNGSGNFSGDLGCYNGFPGDKYVIYGGVRSDTENLVAARAANNRHPIPRVETMTNTSISNITDQHTEWFSHWFNAVLDNVERVIKGKRDQIATALVCVFAEGHLLLEDVPGTGKTTLAKAIAQSIESTWRRIQFTPDLLPSDVTGGLIYDQTDNTFHFRPGPVFANVVLADEINRASPKTQSALLEVMEERHITIDGVTHNVPRPFVVIATQNPIEQEGTYRLPEAQVDRFLLRTSLGYPDNPDEVAAVKAVTLGATAEQLRPVVKIDDVHRMVGVASAVFIDDAIYQYIVDLAAATRSIPELRLGVSTRGALALARSSRALAATQGRPYVTVDDVKTLAPPALAHRMLLTPEAELRGTKTTDLVDRVLDDVDAPVPVRHSS